MQRLVILRPTLGQGGADRVTLLLIRYLDPNRFIPSLVLIRQEGEYVEDAPADLQIISLNASSIWTAVWPTALALRRQQPSIVFSTSSGTNILASLTHWLTGHKSRLVLSERNVLEHSGLTLKRRLVIALKRVLYRRADLITTVSACVKEDVISSLKVPSEDVFVVYNPTVEPDIARKATEALDHSWFAGNEVPVILSAGRLVRQKDFPTLMRAFQLVRKQREARLLILGEGPLRGELQQMAKELGLSADIQLPGFDKNPFRYMARATVFALSSIHEGLANVLIQSMACGTPVISTSCRCGSDEIITRPGDDGLLVPVGDVQALAEKILFLLDHPDERKRIGENGRVSAQRFTVDKIVRRYEAAITGELAPFLED